MWLIIIDEELTKTPSPACRGTRLRCDKRWRLRGLIDKIRGTVLISIATRHTWAARPAEEFHRTSKFCPCVVRWRWPDHDDADLYGDILVSFCPSRVYFFAGSKSILYRMCFLYTIKSGQNSSLIITDICKIYMEISQCFLYLRYASFNNQRIRMNEHEQILEQDG